MSPSSSGNLPAQRQNGLRQEIQLACFRVGSEMYALDIMRIKEIIRPQKLTPVPKSSEFIEGVINLRGAVIPVVDLRKRFDLPPVVDRKTRVIICVVNEKMIGLIVDEVTEVTRYQRHDVRPAPQFVRGKDAQFFLGICQKGDDLVMVMDLEKILSSGEKIDLENIRNVDIQGFVE